MSQQKAITRFYRDENLVRPAIFMHVNRWRWPTVIWMIPPIMYHLPQIKSTHLSRLASIIPLLYSITPTTDEPRQACYRLNSPFGNANINECNSELILDLLVRVGPPFGNANINECNFHAKQMPRCTYSPPFGNANINECNILLAVNVTAGLQPPFGNANINECNFCMGAMLSANLAPPFGNANINECNCFTGLHRIGDM